MSHFRAEADLLLAAHPYVDADPSDIVELLQAATLREIPPATVLCRQGEVADELYFLLRGTVAVVKRDPEGLDRPIGEVHAPTLIGQMAIIDRARRTASVLTASTVLVAAMAWPTFHALVREPGSRGLALRRLLLSSLTRQLVAGTARLRALLAAGAHPDPQSGLELRDEMMRASGLLEGWTDDLQRAEPGADTQPLPRDPRLA
jgi:CRP-like cAMP-binding protein